MSAFFKALITVDDETRKAIKEIILGEARALSRDMVDQEVVKEIKHRLSNLSENTLATYIRNAVANVVRSELTNSWSAIGKEVQTGIDNCVAQRFERSLTDAVKRIFREEIRALIREEMRRVINF